MARVLRRRAIQKWPVGTLRRDIERRNPGRVSSYTRPPKPTADQTPHRSALHVSARRSADGNAYARGAPVPEVEWQRQLAEGEVPQARVHRKPRCPHCKGTGKRAVMPTHKPDCGCFSCLPCKRCGGSGKVEEA